MNTTFRPGRRDDAEPCGQICDEAFKTISAQHNLPADFPNPAAAPAKAQREKFANTRTRP